MSQFLVFPGGEWCLRRRKYVDYRSYVRHQASKLGEKAAHNLTTENCVQGFVKQLLPLKSLLGSHRRTGHRVLCLGARRGAEVLAFRRLGFENAYGIDLNPGTQKPGSFQVPALRGLVLRADFMACPFLSDSFGVLFTNSVDHVFELGAFVAECRRLLRPHGILIMCLPPKNEGGRWECLFWTSWKNVVRFFERRKWRVLKRQRLSSARGAWMQVVLEPINAGQR